MEVRGRSFTANASKAYASGRSQVDHWIFARDARNLFTRFMLGSVSSRKNHRR